MQVDGSTLSRVVSADLIREARLRAGLTQQELAQRSGRERSVIARWEQGGSAPSLETLLDLLAVCGFDLPLELAERDDRALALLRENALLSPERRVERMLRARAKPAAKAGRRRPFDPYAILTALERQRVAYVVVGSFARVIHGVDEIAHGLEITPSRQPPNLARLQRALHELGAIEGGANPAPSEGTFTTEHGLLSVVWEPAGSRRGYTDLRRAASREPIGRGLRPPVASAADLAGMLSALGREEDRPAILALRRLIRLGAVKTSQPRPRRRAPTSMPLKDACCCSAVQQSEIRWTARHRCIRVMLGLSASLYALRASPGGDSTDACPVTAFGLHSGCPSGAHPG